MLLVDQVGGIYGKSGLVSRLAARPRAARSDRATRVPFEAVARRTRRGYPPLSCVTFELLLFRGRHGKLYAVGLVT